MAWRVARAASRRWCAFDGDEALGEAGIVGGCGGAELLDAGVGAGGDEVGHWGSLPFGRGGGSGLGDEADERICTEPSTGRRWSGQDLGHPILGSMQWAGRGKLLVRDWEERWIGLRRLLRIHPDEPEPELIERVVQTPGGRAGGGAAYGHVLRAGGRPGEFDGRWSGFMRLKNRARRSISRSELAAWRIRRTRTALARAV